MRGSARLVLDLFVGPSKKRNSCCAAVEMSTRECECEA